MLSIVLLACACGFAGAMLRPLADRWLSTRGRSAGELALFLEHAAVDVRLGRAAPLVDRLRAVAGKVREPVTKGRVLELCSEAALQAGRLADAASAEEQRESLAQDREERNAIRLRRIGLAAALGQQPRAAELAEPLIRGDDPRLADEARLRLVTSMTEKDLRSWVASTDSGDEEQARRAGLAALRILRDAAQAERLLAPLEKAGQRDASLYQALSDVYSTLGRSQDLARVLGALLAQAKDEVDRAPLVVLRAAALARAGETRTALAALEPLRRSRQFSVRQAARRARYEVLRRAGLLEREVTSLRDPAERAFVALHVERNYEEAVRAYRTACSAHPDSLELAEGLREAERLHDLSERRTLYEQVLAKDPEDSATRDRLFAVLVALGEGDAARQRVREMLEGRAAAPEALVAVAQVLKKAGLDGDAAESLEKAYAAEGDVTRKQQILFLLGEVYAGARHENQARRVYAGLATEGVSPEIRERAIARLASLSR